MKYLGIDYGLKKMGLSISEEGKIASGMGIVDISGLRDALAKIKRVIKDQKIERVVVGVAQSGESRSAAEKFIKKLGEDCEIEVIKVDETLSSYQARDLMIGLGMSKKSRKKEDAIAAVIILQSFLDGLE